MAGCGCTGRARRYPSDTTDPELAVLGPAAEQVMAELRGGRGGRARSHDPRAMLDAIRYLTKYGVEWRAQS